MIARSCLAAAPPYLRRSSTSPDVQKGFCGYAASFVDGEQSGGIAAKYIN
jgi:hypothetical protein